MEHVKSLRLMRMLYLTPSHESTLHSKSLLSHSLSNLVVDLLGVSSTMLLLQVTVHLLTSSHLLD
jgi:hypothetical protein